MTEHIPATDDPAAALRRRIDTLRPHAARIWNYWLLRHEALHDRAGVKDPRRKAVAAA